MNLSVLWHAMSPRGKEEHFIGFSTISVIVMGIKSFGLLSETK